MPRLNEKTGLLFGLANMLLYGIFPIVTHALATRIDPFLFAGLASLFGALPLYLLLKRAAHHKEIFAAALINRLLAIALLSAVATFLLFKGTQLTSGINTGLLVQIEPIYALFLAAIFLQEKVGTRHKIATIIMVIGAVAVVFRGDYHVNAGDLLILAAPLFFQGSHVISAKLLPQVSTATVIPCARLLYGGVVMSLVALLINPQSLSVLSDGSVWLAVILYGFIFRALDLYLWYQALKRLPLSVLSAMLPLAVAISFSGSVLFLGEQPSAEQFVGLALILSGLTLLASCHRVGADA